MFRAQGEVRLKELEERFPNCSSMTLRRDIISLEQQGLVKRTRGGAVAMSTLMVVTEDSYHKRMEQHTEEKQLVAKKAAALFEPGCSIYLDAGSTMMFLARALPDEYCTVLTSGVNIALELTQKENAIISLLGGQVDKRSISAGWEQSIEVIESLNIDIAFMAPSGFTFESGFTCSTYLECAIKKQVVSKARRSIVLMDSSKFGKNMPFTFANLEDVNMIVTDGRMSPELQKKMKALKVDCI